MASSLGGTVTVAIRTRPTADLSPNIQLGADSVAVHLEANPAGGAVVNNGEKRLNLRFPAVLHNASQEDVYDTLGRPLVENVMNGVNGVILCYGQTGSGKSFTQLGDPASFRNRGLMPRAISQVMQTMAAKPEREFSLAVSFMEIYMDRITDLLDGPKCDFVNTVRGPAAVAAAAAGLDGFITPVDYALLEDPVQGIVVRGLTLLPVDTEEDALNALFAGHRARTIAEHSLNRASNRSHCIFTIHVRQKSRVGAGKEKVTVSKLHLVDLAGSERLKKTLIVSDPVTGHTTTLTDETLAKESQWINRSLSSLEAVVVALTRKAPAAGAGPGHVPYRSSKLTHVLRDALGGSCYTVFVANVWPETRHLEETVSTLRLASRMTGVHNEVPVGNTFLDEKALIKRYEATILHLQQELAMHDALRAQAGGKASGGGVVYSEYTPEQRAGLEARLRDYIAAEGEDAEAAALTLESVQQMRELLKLMKHMVKAAGVETEERLRARYLLTPRDGAGAGGAGSSGAAAAGAAGGAGGAGDARGAGGLGRLDATAGGLGLGLASADARPLKVIAPGFGTSTTATTFGFASATGGPAPDFGGTSASVSSAFRPGSSSATAAHGAASLEAVQNAWQKYRSEAGASAAGAAASAKQALAAAKAEVATAARAVNAAKSRIDALSAAANAATTGSKAAGTASGAGAELAAAKAEYRAAHGRYTSAQAQVASAEEGLAGARQELLGGFQAHWEASTGAPLPLAALAGLGATTTTAPGATPLGFTATGFSGFAGMTATGGTSFSLPSLGGSIAFGDDEAVDEAERFDALERQRLVAASNNDPTSVAFYQASKRLVGVGAAAGAGSPRRSGSPTVRLAATNSGRLVSPSSRR